MSEETKQKFYIGCAVLMRGIQGPPMQVLDIFTGKSARCCWFDKELNLHEAQFPLECLMLTEQWPEYVGRAKVSALAQAAQRVKGREDWIGS